MLAGPEFIRADVWSAESEVHPVLVPAADAGWNRWAAPPYGWRPSDRLERERLSDEVERITTDANLSATYVRVVFKASAGERFWGFGERSDAVERSGLLTEHWVGEGPYQLAEYPIIEAITPSWAIRRRTDSTYYPLPWLLSSHGYGVLADFSEWSCHDLTQPGEWSVIVRAPRLSLLIFAGGTPAGTLRLFTEATGRQPLPSRPWFFGPWVQTGQANLVALSEERAILDALERGEAPLSAVETHMRRLPAGAHVDLRAEERARTAEFHRRGLASLTYLSPSVSADYAGVFHSAAAAAAFERRDDSEPFTYLGYIGGRMPPVTDQAQLDFSAAAGRNTFARFVDELVEDGHDGWMEDFGEYTPPDSIAADGLSGTKAHNLYPLRYHRAAAEIVEARGLTPARFVRSGWVGSAPFSPLGWGGDPTTG